MTEKHVRIEAAAKAAYPELWPEDWEQLPASHRASLTITRQGAIGKVTAAIQAYEAAATPEKEDGQAEQVPLADFSISMPDDAAMIQQVLTAITYIDTEGRTAYVVRTMGEGLRTSWLGMCALAQDYILKLP